jgi:phage shock protein A
MRRQSMGIFKRTADVLRANINDMLDRAASPEKMLNQFMMDMREQLEQAKNLVTASIADEKRLKHYIEKEEAMAESWQRKAVKAVESGEDDLAREALEQKWKSEQSLARYRKSWEQQKGMVDNLKEALKALRDKMVQAGKQKNLLLARARRSEAASKIHQTMSTLADRNAFHAFQQVADKIEGLEYKSEAAMEISKEMEREESFRRLEELETDFNVEKALQELKEKIGKT